MKKCVSALTKYLSCEYQGQDLCILNSFIHFKSFLLFTRVFFLAPFLKSPLRTPDSEVFVLRMHFHRIRVNEWVKRRQMSPFLHENVVV